jgi:transketolase
MHLTRKADELRLHTLDMVFAAQSGHIAPAFSIAEIITVLYFRILRLKRGDPAWQGRDRFVLSKGHGCAALYAVLADLGFFSRNDLSSFRKLGSHLQGHPKTSTPGVDVSTGPLGLGASVACGLALGGSRFGKFNVYALLSDGELDAGIVWEAALFASHQRLANLTFIIDRNDMQYTGPTEAVLALEPLNEKWRSFGWEVKEVDGHDIQSLIDVFSQRPTGFPRVVLAHTIKGKGVSFMENVAKWHGTAPNENEYHAARRELLTRLHSAAAPA